MRLYALLLIALYAIAARAATIPDNAALHEKKIEDISKDKASQQEEQLINSANIINDVENKLRFKPTDIPVEVIVENVNPALKVGADKEDSDIHRQPIDLNNPGLPQRQEHDSQTPDFYAAELNLVESYKKSLNEAQMLLKQGFQGISEGIQNMFENNEQPTYIQKSIQSLRDGFVAQINKLSGSVQNYLNNVKIDDNSPIKQQTKANLEQLKVGLNTLKSDFTKEVNTLANGVEIFASLKADTTGENKPSSEPTQAPSAAENPFMAFINTIQQNTQQAMANLPFLQGWGQGQQTGTDPVNPPEPEAQSDTQPSSTTAPAGIWPNFPNPFAGFLNDPPPEQPGPVGSGNGIFAQAIQNFLNIWRPPTEQPEKPANPGSSATEEKPSEQTQSVNKPESQTVESKPSEPAAQSSQDRSTTAGPIKQMLQNNPISKGIANAVQKLQNINNPQTPRDEEIKKPEEEPVPTDDLKKRHDHPGSGDNNDGDRVKETEPAKQIQNEITPEVPETQKESEKEHKTEQVVDKTE